MTSPTHLAFGLLSAAGFLNLAGVPLQNEPLALAAAALGSQLPDLDTPHSPLGLLVPSLSTAIERRWGHRALTHGLVALAGLAGLLLPAALLWPRAWAACLIGYSSHLVLDCATPSGVPLLYPHSCRCGLLTSSRWRPANRSLGERFLLAFFLLLLGVSLLVSAAGGLWSSMRYLLATPAAAYADYSQITGEALLDFRGRWRDSHEPVSGQAVILDGDRDGFIIVLDGQIRRYAADGDILPLRTRIRATGRSVQRDTLEVRGLDWPGLLDLLAPPAPPPLDPAWISGQLQADRPFVQRGVSQAEMAEVAADPAVAGLTEPTPAAGPRRSLRRRGDLVQFCYASAADLRTFDPVAAVDPGQRLELWHQVLAAQHRLTALRRGPLPSWPGVIRDAEASRDALIRRYHAQTAAPVRFTGTLWRRTSLPGLLAPHAR